MSGGWSKGDLALCVSLRHPRYRNPSRLLRVGAIYTVDGTYRSKTAGLLALVLAEVTPNKHPGFPADMFRKIHPLTDEEHRQALAEIERVREGVS